MTRPNAEAHAMHEAVRARRRRIDPITKAIGIDGSINLLQTTESGSGARCINFEPTGGPYGRRVNIEGVFSVEELRTLVAHLEKYAKPKDALPEVHRGGTD
jgi:hypothetical protein